MADQQGHRNRYNPLTGSSRGGKSHNAPQRETVEGDHRQQGYHQGRGYVSPLGNAGTERKGDLSRNMENVQQQARGSNPPKGYAG